MIEYICTCLSMFRTPESFILHADLTGHIRDTSDNYVMAQREALLTRLK